MRANPAPTPESIVPRVERLTSGLPEEVEWPAAPAFMLRRAEDGEAPGQATAVRLACDATSLLVRFDCEDRDIWATHVVRDAPLWEEEVVEIFIAPGTDDPREYVEIEVNPLGAIFDARVMNPDGRRDTMSIDTSWNAAGLSLAVSRPTPGAWRVDIEIPWADLCAGVPPRFWRANFFRIDRPRAGAHEFSSWSPTYAVPADFHKPACFGRLALDGVADRR